METKTELEGKVLHARNLLFEALSLNCITAQVAVAAIADLYANIIVNSYNRRGAQQLLQALMNDILSYMDRMEKEKVEC